MLKTSRSAPRILELFHPSFRLAYNVSMRCWEILPQKLLLPTSNSYNLVLA